MNRNQLEDCKRIVVKVGSSLLDQSEDRSVVKELADQVHQLRNENRELVLVTSGAILFGMESMDLQKYPDTLPKKQATAAIGQFRLMNYYEEHFAELDLHVAQVLLTQQGIHNRETYLNASNTLNTLLDMGAVPIVNENDTEATDEIQFGDNDTLSALATTMVDADLLVILTDVDGLYPGNPKEYDQPIHEVEEIDREIKELAKPTSESKASVGGMTTKIDAAEKVTRAGTPMVIGNGNNRNILSEILRGREVGTFFHPRAGQEAIQGRKRWIRYHLPCKGTILVDQGASEALRERGKSLLPSGVVSVEGHFERGDAVRVLNHDENEIGRGLTNYSSSEVEKLKGCQSEEISDILGYHNFDEIIHRDNLVIISDSETNSRRSTTG